MAHGPPVGDWQSFPIEFRNIAFPSLQDSAASAGNTKRQRTNRNRIPNAVLNLHPMAHPPGNYWENNTDRPNLSKWSEDEVNAAHSTEDPSFPSAIDAPLPTLKSVETMFTDRLIASTRYNSQGYDIVGNSIKKEILTRHPDPIARYRSLSITINEKQNRTDTWLNQPDPAETPKWINCLPDNTLNEEYKLLCHVRPLDIPLGPRALNEIIRRCPYKSMANRTLPKHKEPPIIAAPTPAPRKSLQGASQGARQVPWKGRSNDVRLSGNSSSSSNQPSENGRQSRNGSCIETKVYGSSSTSSNQSSEHGRHRRNGPSIDIRSNGSHHDQSSQHSSRQFGENNFLEFWNTRFAQPSHNRGCREQMEPRYNTIDNVSTRSKVDYERESYHGNPTGHSNRYNDGYNKNEKYHRSNSRNDYEYREDSGYLEHDNSSEYERERVRNMSDLKTVARKNNDEREEWSEGKRRNPDEWTERRSDGSMIEAKEKEAAIADPDERAHWPNPNVSQSIRRILRCLDGMPASSCTAYHDDMNRIELSTWSGELDAEQVTARMNEKYGIREMTKESRERRVMLALPRTTITLSVGAGGEAEIIFDEECTDVLVRGRRYDDIKDFITENVVKTRDFNSYSRNILANSPTNNTVITFGSAAESRAVRERLSYNDIDAKKIPRDLITGYWDGSYAKRECVLELEWERHGTHGISVRFQNLREQNNLVDRVMREKSEYMATSNLNMEECNNKMYVFTPASPFPVDDDVKFLRRLLETNGVEVTSVAPIKVKEPPQTIDTPSKRTNCTFAINRRMLKVAIEEGVWGGFHPRTVAEWQMMLDGGKFSWMVEMHNDADLARNGVNSATVQFDSFEQGDRIATQVQRMTPNPIGDDRFILNKDDRKGVFARAKLRVHYNVPVLVYAFTAIRLRKLDDRWRQQSHFNYADFQTEREPCNAWTCLITDEKEATPPGYARLIVEGFPKSAVEDSCAQLLSVIRGNVIKCDGAESFLLTGIGRNMANIVAKEALEKRNVLVDFNVVGKEIRMIGEEFNIMVVESRLRKIAEKGENYVMETVVSITQPAFMNRTSTAIEFCGGLNMMERVIGECRISICAEDPDKRSLDFKGTVAAYNRMRDFLGDLDDTLRHSAKEAYEKLRKTDKTLEDSSLSPLTSPLLCPICSCRPSPSDFYRLEACGHVYCTACIYHQLHSELSSRSLPISCRSDGCECKLAVSDLLRLLLGRDPDEREVESASIDHLDEIKLRPLVTAIVTNALQTQRDRLIACRTADCAGIFPRQSADHESIARCKTCERTTCGSCGYEPHRGYTCEEYEGLRDNVDVSIASYMKNKKVRKCPNTSCSAVIEKTIGCNHMECVICRTHFCWLCGHASKTQGEIYAHMQNDHGGNGLHMDDGEMFMLQFD